VDVYAVHALEVGKFLSAFVREKTMAGKPMHGVFDLVYAHVRISGGEQFALF